MHHTLAYFKNVAASTLEDLTPIVDQTIQDQNGGFFLDRPLDVIDAAVTDGDIQYAQLKQPSLNCVGYHYIGNLQDQNGLFGETKGFFNYKDYPVRLKALEQIKISAFQDNAGAQDVYAALHVAEGLTPVPSGRRFTFRGTSTTAAVASTWTELTTTWSEDLPAGRYGVIGGLVVGVDALLFRINAQNCKLRPGGYAVNDTTVKPSRWQRWGGVGQWCDFQNTLMPKIEVLCSSTTATWTVYLDLVEIG